MVVQPLFLIAIAVQIVPVSYTHLQDFSPKTGYDDAFFIDLVNESVIWMYYNPDSNAGGQYVTNRCV